MQPLDDPERLSDRIVQVAFGKRALDVQPLAGSEIRVVVADLENPPIPLDECREFMTPDERERAERFRVEKPRTQFVATRGLLRSLLGQLLEEEPRKVQIAYTATGKPILDGTRAWLHFNVSHTDGLAIIGFARSEIGIDVERVRAMENPDGLVARFFSAAEAAEYASLDPTRRQAAFFRGWTCKEALLKAAGLSVAYLDAFDVRLDPEQPAALLAARHSGLAATDWGLIAWSPPGGYSAALAVRGAKGLTISGNA